MLLGESEDEATENQSGAEDTQVPAAITDAGCERELNEDRYAVVEGASGLAWIVCDGLGGAAGGELAAQLAIDAIRRDLETMPRRPAEVALRSSISEANRIIVLRRQNQAFAQMGTTIVSTIFVGPEVVIAHAGDSRAYLIRDGAIQQLTIDHTYVQELVDKGQIKPEEALVHPEAHKLTRCIGSEPSLQVDVQRFWIWEQTDGNPGDALMLCTDGLYSLVSEGEIANIVSQHAPQTACVKLVELTKSRGGYDNITIAVIPLAGQLRNDPPPGYKPAVTRFAGTMGGIERPSTRSFGRDSMIVLMLVVLSAIVTAFMSVFMMSR